MDIYRRVYLIELFFVPLQKYLRLHIITAKEWNLMDTCV
jgi:hypothetical protein